MNTRKLRRFEPLENQTLFVGVGRCHRTAISSSRATPMARSKSSRSATAPTASPTMASSSPMKRRSKASPTTFTSIWKRRVAGTNDTVTVDLGGQTVDKVYAELGDGDNSFELVNGTATGLDLSRRRRHRQRLARGHDRVAGLRRRSATATTISPSAARSATSRFTAATAPI